MSHAFEIIIQNMTKTDYLCSETDSLDAYYKKDVFYKYKGQKLSFRVSQALFSSQDIDLGTQRLLQTIATENIPHSKVLDLGCGYGPIGISLKKARPSSTVHMTDRNALAVEYSRINSERNNVKTRVFASLGYDHVADTNYDLVVSNIPAKVGEQVLSYMLDEARYYLRSNGIVAIVVIDAIADYIKMIMANMEVNIIFQRKWLGHTVIIYKFKTDTTQKEKSIKNSLERNIYFRGEKAFMVKGVQFMIRTAYDLPEFNTLSYETEMISDEIIALENKEINRVIVFNPNQGIIPVSIARFVNSSEILLSDRDLLALEMAKGNLISNGFNKENISIHHKVDIKLDSSNNMNLIVGVLDKKDIRAVHAMYLKQSVNLLSPGGIIIMTSGSTSITRIEELTRGYKSLSKIRRKKTKGKSVIVLKKSKE